MANANDILQRVQDLLSEKISLDDFEDWFLPYSWNIHKTGNLLAQRLAYSIERQLSECEEDGEELRRRLEDAIRPYRQYGFSEAPKIYIFDLIRSGRATLLADPVLVAPHYQFAYDAICLYGGNNSQVLNVPFGSAEVPLMSGMTSLSAGANQSRVLTMDAPQL